MLTFKSLLYAHGSSWDSLLRRGRSGAVQFQKRLLRDFSKQNLRNQASLVSIQLSKFQCSKCSKTVVLHALYFPNPRHSVNQGISSLFFLDWMVWHTVWPWGKPKGRKPKKPAVFQREPEEGHCPHRSNHVDKRLGMILSHEPEEQSDSDTSTGSEPPGPSVFCLGWHELTRTCKANLTRDASQAGRQVQQKRPYDNKQRAEKAAYVRKGGQFKKNGVSEKRILQILSKDICLCNPVQN